MTIVLLVFAAYLLVRFALTFAGVEWQTWKEAVGFFVFALIVVFVLSWLVT